MEIAEPDEDMRIRIQSAEQMNVDSIDSTEIVGKPDAQETLEVVTPQHMIKGIVMGTQLFI